MDTFNAAKALTQTHEVARAHALTAYDATYLELAIREGRMLAAPDAKLKAAAQLAGVPVFS